MDNTLEINNTAFHNEVANRYRQHSYHKDNHNISITANHHC